MKKYENTKKVELHCHLDGSLSPEKVSKWVRKNISDVKKDLQLEKPGNLEEYLSHFSYPISLLQTKSRLKDASEELCKEMMNENVVYAEIRFDPMSHMKKGLSLKEVIESVLEGINSTELKAKIILVMKRERSFDENKQVIDIAKKYLKKGVACVDLAGNEKEYPTRNFEELFDYAKEANVPFIIHAGEAGDFRNIDAAISFGAVRIGHGVQAIKSFETMEELKRYDIPLEICVSSNVDTGLYKSYKDHPVMRLLDSGVSITINTDNRCLSKTTLTDEYNILNKYFGFTIEDFNEMNRCAIRHAFLTDKEKEELLKMFE